MPAKVKQTFLAQILFSRVFWIASLGNSIEDFCLNFGLSTYFGMIKLMDSNFSEEMAKIRISQSDISPAPFL
jgi:hypothetical protein